MRLRLRTCLSQLALTAPLLLACAAPAQQKGKTIALVVGIEDYQQPESGPKVPRLFGCRNDVTVVTELLRSRFGCQDIVTLVDEQATHAAILRELHAALVEKADQDTTVVFWYAGHGARVPDRSGRDGGERNDAFDIARDSTLVAWDSRAKARDGSYDVSDDELWSLFVASKAREIVFVSDCCHSGGVLRGGDIGDGVRDAGAGTAPIDRALVDAIWPGGERAPLRDDDDDALDVDRIVHVAACSTIEEAGEFTLGSGHKHGTLTWFLTRVLRKCDGQASWREVVDEARARAVGRGNKPSQTIQLASTFEGAIFGGRARPAPPGFSVVRDGAKFFRVEAGRVHGIGRGATFRLVDYEGKERGRLTADRVRTTFTVAEKEGDGSVPAIALRAVPLHYGEDAPLLRLQLADGVDQAPFADSPLVELVTADPDYMVEADGEQMLLCCVEEGLCFPLPADAAELEQRLVRERNWRSLWLAASNSGTYEVSMRVRAATREEAKDVDLVDGLYLPGAESGDTGALVATGAFEDAHSTKGGRRLVIEVRNDADKPLHVQLLSMTQAREVSVLRPLASDNVLGPGQSRSKVVVVGLDPTWPAAERGPMIDRYLVVATERPVDFAGFAAKALSPTRGGDGVAGMPPFLKEALTGARTRGDAPATGDWGIATCDLRLVSPEAFAAARKSLPAPR